MAMAGRSAAQKILVKAGSPSLSAAPLSTSSSLNGTPERPSRMGDAAQLAAMKRGGGFRSSFSGMVATVFGATGCLGRGVTNRLGKTGTQMILPYHGEHYDSMRLKVCGDLGQVLFTPYNLRDEESIKTAMKHSNVVVNLIGREHHTLNFDFNDVNVEGPARLARLAREAGIERFVHMSHVNAREKPERVFLPNGSDWLRTKWLGEQRVLEEFPDATIIRSTDAYGFDDKFLNYWLSWTRFGFYGAIPVWNKGEGIVKSPIHITDVSQAIVNSLTTPGAKGTTYEIAGPDQFMLSDLLDYVFIGSGRDEDWFYKRTNLMYAPHVFAASLVGGYLPLGNKLYGGHSLDKLERTSLSEEFLGLPDISELGVKPVRCQEKMKFELQHRQAFGHYNPVNQEDLPTIPDLIPLSRTEIKECKAAENGIFKAIGF